MNYLNIMSLVTTPKLVAHSLERDELTTCHVFQRVEMKGLETYAERRHLYTQCDIAIHTGKSMHHTVQT